MKNKYRVVGNVVVIELENKAKEVYYAQADIKHLEKIQATDGTWRLFKYKEFIYARNNKTGEFLHRLLCPGLAKGSRVIHKNGDTLNCTEANMYVVNGFAKDQTPVGVPVGKGPEAPAGQSKVSGIKGVTYHKHSGKWAATCFLNGRRNCLGYHETPEQAAAAIEKFKEGAK